MKKLSLILVAFLFSLVIGFSSCNGCGGNAQEVASDSTEVVKDSIAIDSTAVDSIVVDSTSKSLNKPLGEWP